MGKKADKLSYQNEHLLGKNSNYHPDVNRLAIYSQPSREKEVLTPREEEIRIRTFLRLKEFMSNNSGIENDNC